MIAALTRTVLGARNGDPARVYIAGLSAGGAMAALVAGLYPELFAAAGVHSGLPAGAAGETGLDGTIAATFVGVSVPLLVVRRGLPATEALPLLRQFLRQDGLPAAVG